MSPDLTVDAFPTVNRSRQKQRASLNYWGCVLATSQASRRRVQATPRHLSPIKHNQMSSSQSGIVLQDKIEIGFRYRSKHLNKFHVFDVADQCFLCWRPARLCMPEYTIRLSLIMQLNTPTVHSPRMKFTKKKPLGVACKSITYFIQIHSVVRGKCELKTSKQECIYPRRGYGNTLLPLSFP